MKKLILILLALIATSAQAVTYTITLPSTAHSTTLTCDPDTASNCDADSILLDSEGNSVVTGVDSGDYMFLYPTTGVIGGLSPHGSISGESLPITAVWGMWDTSAGQWNTNISSLSVPTDCDNGIISSIFRSIFSNSPRDPICNN